jgi:hypothetical protein
MRKLFIAFLCTLFVFIVFLFSETVLDTPSLFSFLSDTGNEGEEYEIGKVEVGYRLYFEKDGTEVPGRFVEVDPGATDPNERYKQGVYEVNITERESDNFIENLRIDVLVDSNVETYLRVRLIDVLVLKYTNAAGVTSEIQVINKDELQLNYDESWHRAADGYYYYMEPVKKEASGSKLVPFIIEYFEGTYYNLHPANYSIQLGIEIDAVQALGGPEKRWNLETPPWGGSWQ